MATTRAFIAVDIADDVCERAGDLRERLRQAGAAVKWVERGQFHLTLKFLGDITDQEIAWVCNRAAIAAKASAPIQAGFRGANAFPKPESPRTIWLGLDEGADELIELQASLEEQLIEGRFPRETRQFHPHLTLGRVKRGGAEVERLAQLIEKYERFDAGNCTINSLVVYASELRREGPIYTVLSRSALGEEREKEREERD